MNDISSKPIKIKSSTHNIEIVDDFFWKINNKIMNNIRMNNYLESLRYFFDSINKEKRNNDYEIGGYHLDRIRNLKLYLKTREYFANSNDTEFQLFMYVDEYENRHSDSVRVFVNKKDFMKYLTYITKKYDKEISTYNCILFHDKENNVSHNCYIRVNHLDSESNPAVYANNYSYVSNDFSDCKFRIYNTEGKNTDVHEFTVVRRNIKQQNILSKCGKYSLNFIELGTDAWDKRYMFMHNNKPLYQVSLDAEVLDYQLWR